MSSHLNRAMSDATAMKATAYYWACITETQENNRAMQNSIIQLVGGLLDTNVIICRSRGEGPSGLGPRDAGQACHSHVY